MPGDSAGAREGRSWNDGRGSSAGYLAGPGYMQSVSTLLSVLTPLVLVPLTVIMFYLRSMREHQLSWHAALVRRVDAIEDAVAEVRRSIKELEHEYTTKEEWLRECMHTRRLLERVADRARHMDAADREPTADGSRVSASPGGTP